MKLNTETKSSGPAVIATAYVPLDHIVENKGLHYRDLDQVHVASLVDDIKVNGLDVPLITFAETADKKIKIGGSGEPVAAHFLVAGRHRREALRKLRASDAATFKKLFPQGIPVNHRVISVKDALFLSLRENVQRREMTAEQIFPVLQKLTDEYKMTGKEIAKHIGKSTSWVSQMLAALTEPDPETVAEITAGKIAVGDARKLGAKIKADRKSGKVVTKDSIREEAGKLTTKQAAKVASGAQRSTGDDRKTSLKKLYSRYQALPNLPLGRKLQILELAIQYSIGEKSSLPPELKKDIKPTKVEKK
jgi:ParB-like chromosome segregation protein Spo0J